MKSRVGVKGHIPFGGRLARDVKGFPASAMAEKMSGGWRNPDHIRAWALRTATLVALLQLADLTAARVVHGIAAPLIFTALAWHYLRHERGLPEHEGVRRGRGMPLPPAPPVDEEHEARACPSPCCRCCCASPSIGGTDLQWGRLMTSLGREATDVPPRLAG